MAIQYHTTSKPKKDGGKSVRGFWDNFLNEVHETAAGFFPGIAEIGSAVVHDAGKVVGINSGEFRTDDIAKAIKDGYTDEGTTWGETGRKWAALLRGDIDDYKRHRARAMDALYERPLGPILDAGAFVTLGAGAASRGAGLAAKAAPEGSRARSFMASTAGLEPGDLSRRQRTITASEGGLEFSRTLSRNPTTRARQEAFEAISAKVDPNTPLIGHNRRVGRNLRRQFHREELAEAARTLKPARKALAGMRGRERRAVTLMALGHDLFAYGGFINRRIDAVEAEIKRKEALGRRKNDPGDMIDVDDVPATRGLPQPDQPLQIARAGATPDVTPDAVAGAGDLVVPDKGDLVLRDGKAKRTDGDEDLADEMPDDEDFAALAQRDRQESLKRNRRNLAFLKKRQAEIADQRFGSLMANPTPKMQEALEALTALSETTTNRLIREGLSPEKAAMRASLESRIMRAAGIDVPVYGGAIRSHIAKHNEQLDVTGGATTAKVTRPGKLGELQRNSGYNFWNARDNLDPAMFLHSARQVFQYRARLDRFQKLLDGAVLVSPEEALAYSPKTHKFLDADSRLRKEASEVYGILHDAEEILAGTPMYDDLMRTIERSLIDPRDRMRGPGAQRIGDDVLGVGDSPGSTPTIAVIPNGVYDEILGEFIKSSEFVRRFYDKPTQVWRALTLNLRPAWMVNNFVGQQLLLAFAHGARGLKNYVLQFGGEGKRKADLVDELSPELVDFGWAHESLNDIAGLGSKSRILRFARRFSDFMGELNAKLTDSHTRKAAWLSEMDPHVKRLQKQDPSISYEDAARQLWKDERFADEITQRVLDDMIDFSDLSSFERTYIKRAIPFYSWIKGSSKRGARLVTDETWKAVAMENVSDVGVAALEEQYGELPEFLKGMIPLTGGENPLVMTTQGLNPWVTPADVLGMLSGTVTPGRHSGPQNPLSSFNPYIKAPAEALANRDFFYGGPVDRDDSMSFLARIIKQGGNSLAQKRVIDEYLQQRRMEQEGLDYDPLYEPSFRNAIASYMGLPIRNLDTRAARARAVAEAARQ